MVELGYGTPDRIGFNYTSIREIIPGMLFKCKIRARRPGSIGMWNSLSNVSAQASYANAAILRLGRKDSLRDQ
jgi:hypothetical protein